MCAMPYSLHWERQSRILYIRKEDPALCYRSKRAVSGPVLIVLVQSHKQGAWLLGHSSDTFGFLRLSSYIASPTPGAMAVLLFEPGPLKGIVSMVCLTVLWRGGKDDLFMRFLQQ